jgi:hypothetical protein
MSFEWQRNHNGLNSAAIVRDSATELAKAVAEFLFGDEKKMVRIDMSEYQEGTVSVDKLIGAAGHRWQ